MAVVVTLQQVLDEAAKAGKTVDATSVAFTLGWVAGKAALAVSSDNSSKASPPSAASSESDSEPIDFIDPHFHVWDVTGDGPHDGEILFAPEGKAIFRAEDYEKMMTSTTKGLRHAGGVFIEAVSVCFPAETGPSFLKKCIREAKWAAATLKTSKLPYKLMPTAALEEDGALATLKQLQAIDGVIGIRQILNYEPSWPRNKKELLGNLLENPKWVKGLTGLAHLGMHFDAQLNPHQYMRALEVFNAVPNLHVFINHLGTPTLADLKAADSPYWQGMEAFAARPNTYIKISMLCYITPDWDKCDLVSSTVHRIIQLFGPNRCMMASNFPVDHKDAWPADRLFPALLCLASRYSRQDQRKLFGGTALALYK